MGYIKRTSMKVNFFNIPYVLFEGEMSPKNFPDIFTTTEHNIGVVYGETYRIPFPICIYNCLYEHEKDWI